MKRFLLVMLLMGGCATGPDPALVGAQIQRFNQASQRRKDLQNDTRYRLCTIWRDGGKPFPETPEGQLAAHSPPVETWCPEFLIAQEKRIDEASDDESAAGRQIADRRAAVETEAEDLAATERRRRIGAGIAAGLTAGGQEMQRQQMLNRSVTCTTTGQITTCQ